MAEEIARKPEDIVWRGNPSNVLHFRTYLFCGAAFFLILAASFAAYTQEWIASGRGTLTLASMALIPAAVAGYLNLLIRSTIFEITTQRVFYTTGILSKQRDQLEIYRIKDMQVLEPFFLRMFGLGNIVLETSDHSHPQFEMNAVPRPRELADQLRHYVEKRREEKGVRELDMGGRG